MDTTPQPGAPRVEPDSPDPQGLERVQDSDEFKALRRSFRGFAFPVTVAFIAWYLLYVLLSSYAQGFMGAILFGHINVALLLGLLQFASTFIIAWLYARHAARRLDPAATAIRERLTQTVPASREGTE